MSIETKLVTVKELWAMPENGGRNELLDGELLPMSPTNMRHMQVAAKIQRILQEYLESHPIGVVGQEMGCVISRDPPTVLAPDVVFVGFDRIPRGPLPEEFFEGAPDLAVEVLSPSDTWQKMEAKAGKYVEGGTRLVWLVNPNTESVTIFRPGMAIKYLKKSDAISGEDVLAGFSAAVAEFFS